MRSPETQALIRAFEGAGHETYFVGGCVRNALLGVPVSDIDISTIARPDTVTNLAENAGFTVHPTGIDHGTVTVPTLAGPLEITTFRKDISTDGRRAVVAFADTIEEDAIRRDFTMNALYARSDGVVVDPLGGLPDLQDRHVRFIEDPVQRIREDYLRILRFFRFHAHFGRAEGGLDAEGLAACAAEADGLEALSKERIGAELLKLLNAPDPAPAMAAMEQSGCLNRILPGATAAYLAPLGHLERGIPPSPIRRLAAMNTQDARVALRLSKAHSRALETIQTSAHQMLPADVIAYRHGATLARDAVLVRCALLGNPAPDDLEQALARGSTATFPVQAADLPGIAGPALGQRLKVLEERWIASAFSLSKVDLLK